MSAVDHRARGHRPGEQREQREAADFGARLNDVGDRRAEHADKRQADAGGDLAAVRGMLAKLMDEQQHDAADRDQRAPREAPARPMAEKRPAEQAAGNEQQREHRRDHARRDVPLGEIDGVEVDAELGEAEERGGEQALRSEPQIFRPSTRATAAMADGGDDEAVGDRPLRRHRAELAADDDPGRAPDRGEDDERNATSRRARDRRAIPRSQLPASSVIIYGMPPRANQCRACR